MALNVLSEAELAQLRQASLVILERIGVRLQHPNARDMLAAHGCSVEGERVRITASLLEKLLEKVPRGFCVFGRNLSHQMHYGGGEVHYKPVIGVPYIYDIDTGERRPPTLADAGKMVRLLDALPGFSLVNSVGHSSDVPPEMVAVVDFLTCCQFSDKPSDGTIVSGAQARAIARIGAAIRGSEQALREKPLTVIYVSPTSPLSYAYDQADAIMETAKAGIPLAPLPCPVLGISSPITLAGVLAQNTAEVLSTLVLAYLVNPGVPLVYCTRPSPGEMHSGAALWGSPENGLASAAAVQLAHSLGMPANASGLTTSSKAMDEQAASEKTLNALTAALAGCEVITGGGCLEDVLSATYQQLVIDDEIISAIGRVIAGIKVDAETLAVEVIERVMDGSNFLSEPHTRKFFRSNEIWRARLWDQEFFHTWRTHGAKRTEERAAERARQILAAHHPAPLAPEVQREADAILRAAERELVTAGMG